MMFLIYIERFLTLEETFNISIYNTIILLHTVRELSGSYVLMLSDIYNVCFIWSKGAVVFKLVHTYTSSTKTPH